MPVFDNIITHFKVSLQTTYLVDHLKRLLDQQDVIFRNLDQYYNEISGLLNHLRRLSLGDHSSKQHFVEEFCPSTPYNGMELLLRLLSIIQRAFYYETLRSNQSTINVQLLSSLYRSYAASESMLKRIKSVGALESSCLEVIYLITQLSSSPCLCVLQRVTNFEIMLVSVSSPQLDSKCFALEILLRLLSFPGCFAMLFKALTAIAGKNRDDYRFTILICQLMCGLNTSRLHIQVLITRLINELIRQSGTIMQKILVQCELELAGFDADALEKLIINNSRYNDRNQLKQHLEAYRNLKLDLTLVGSESGVSQPGEVKARRGLVESNPLYNHVYYRRRQSVAMESTESGDDSEASSRLNCRRPQARNKYSESAEKSQHPRYVGGILKKAKSEQNLAQNSKLGGENFLTNTRSPREEQIFGRHNGNFEKKLAENSASPSDFTSTPENTSNNYPNDVQKIDRHYVKNVDRQKNLTRQSSTANNFDKSKMKGFSYLCPEKPILVQGHPSSSSEQRTPDLSKQISRSQQNLTHVPDDVENRPEQKFGVKSGSVFYVPVTIEPNNKKRGNGRLLSQRQKASSTDDDGDSSGLSQSSTNQKRGYIRSTNKNDGRGLFSDAEATYSSIADGSEVSLSSSVIFNRSRPTNPNENDVDDAMKNFDYLYDEYDRIRGFPANDKRAEGSGARVLRYAYN